MTDENNIEEISMQEMYKELNDKITLLSSILEKFGMDLITKLGQTNLKLNKLTDKVDELHDATIDVKSMSPQFYNIIQGQKTIIEEIELIKTLTTNVNNVSKTDLPDVQKIERKKDATDMKKSIQTKLLNLQTEISHLEDPQEVISILENIKELIFEFTGGHRILYEISQIINRMNTLESLSENFDIDKPDSLSLKDYLGEKITFWINKLELKHSRK
ncbi:MAG: hypothetical protein KGD73_11455 [Candidatus Lokiarchaeota archaeon]|nr:hypothetical protein [Candidatus Lokiarchaeota archaeon]